ncbi:MAG: hypothetical protein KKD07_09775, partial [Candidatus Omnitrophica bacterium]|nr:hypothetical protein [Candidatus Omnitrophota bacterium]
MKTDHFKMLHNIEELTHLFSTSRNLHEFLDGTVNIIRQHLTLTACGIYISNERTNCLSLEACFGLNYEELKKVSFAPGEG